MKAVSASLVALALVSGCSVYGDDLFGPKDDGRSLGGQGGEPPAASGGAPTGGSTAEGGGPAPGGGSGGEATGGSATGGQPSVVCKGAFSNVSETSLLDDFDGGSRNSGGDFEGIWASYGNGTGLTPSQNTSWSYEQDECLDEGDTSLHVEATGYTQWSHFIFDLESNTDLTGYDGIVFWGRSSTSFENTVRFKIYNDASSKPDSVSKTLSKGEWKQYKIPFPADVAREQTSEFWFVIAGADTFDFWIDDLSFYKE